ncbi:dirigent protein 22 [Vitis vinifera]|uniref:dirigent protein 22 n=1 Tax=Vitis vinifera TaxID=29760 RepID=UPI00015C7C18|nr:dirigent protein 22 [Vitis vinifera]|eukprot:XP_002285681.1 PREDICTED: dirigent protein 22 [Vitis vinifera]
MAKALLVSPSYFIFFIFLIFSSATVSIFGEEYSYVKSINPKKMNMLKEKVTHFQLYWQDVVSGSNATSVTVLEEVNNSSTLFGSVSIIDNSLTVGPNLSSKTVGKSQGLYASTGLEETSLLMVMNFAFTDGKYNGSTFTVVGRNNVNAKVREMPIIGGSGLFRFARGYVLASTYSFSDNGDGTIEYNCYVIHY